MKPRRRRLGTRPKLLALPVAAVLGGLVIAGGIGMADSGSTPASTHTAPDREDSPRTAAPEDGCAVSYHDTNWPGQFNAEVTITNTGSEPIDGWTLAFSFPGDQAVSSAWNATFEQQGSTVSATNEGFYDAAIEPGASRSLGFLGTWQSENAAPAEFRLNGTDCS